MDAELKKQMDEQIVDGGYTRKQLTEAFERVQNTENWKLPTNRIVVETEEEARLIDRAITFFTGGCPGYAKVGGDLGNPCYIVFESEGYYFHIGS